MRARCLFEPVRADLFESLADFADELDRDFFVADVCGFLEDDASRLGHRRDDVGVHQILRTPQVLPGSGGVDARHLDQLMRRAAFVAHSLEQLAHLVAPAEVVGFQPDHFGDHVFGTVEETVLEEDLRFGQELGDLVVPLDAVLGLGRLDLHHFETRFGDLDGLGVFVGEWRFRVGRQLVEVRVGLHVPDRVFGERHEGVGLLWMVFAGRCDFDHVVALVFVEELDPRQSVGLRCLVL